MNTNIMTENLYLKKKFMTHRFGKFKGAVLRLIQYNYFTKKSKELINNNIVLTENKSDNQQKIESVKIMYTYLYTTKDIWSYHKPLKIKIREQLIDFTKSEPNIFKQYLIAFGYICPYLENNELCGKRVNGYLCPKHRRRETNRNICINKSLKCLPDELCNIIIEYSIDYSWKL